MRAMLVTAFGEPGTVGDKPRPEPEAGELLVRVRAAGVNAMDAMVRAGFMKDFMEHRFPLTPGQDYAGTVEALGPEVEGFAPGDEIFGAVGKAYLGGGSFAEYVTVNAALASRRPAGLAPEAAAALTTAGTTALVAVDALDAEAGDTIAVVGAAGGVGGFAVQLATLRGFRVVAVTREEHEPFVRELGAIEVLDYRRGDLTSQLRRAVPDGLAGIVDVFHDADGLLALVPAIKPGGTIATPSAMGAEAAFEGQSVRVRPVRAAVNRAGELAHLAAEGTLKVPLETLPLDQAPEAVHRQATRGNRGKLVLKVG